MQELNVRNYAHIGDAVYEVFIREKIIYLTSNSNKMHKYTVKFVNAQFQTDLLEKLSEYLTEEEKDLARRARNIPTSSARRINHTLHRQATVLEVLLGYAYIHNKERYNEFTSLLEKLIDFDSEIATIAVIK